METERLYYQDAYCKNFEARVLECTPGNGRWELVLDRTAFYPEGGGQPADTGELTYTNDEGMDSRVRISDVHERGDRIVHYAVVPVEAGTCVTGRIDWERRFDLMQQHTGEHIVSGLIHKTFGYDNKGFHMGADVITIDLNEPMTEQDLAMIEEMACRVIWEDRNVRILFPSDGELASIEYRSKKEISGQVRIVDIDGADVCACCGTHVARTGEVGMVKLLSVVKFRDGVRIEMICGGRVLRYLNMLQRQNHEVSVSLSAKPEQTAQAVQRLLDEAYALRGRIHELEESDFAGKAQSLAGKGDVLLFEKGLEADSVRRLTDAVTHTCGGRCAVFSDNADGTYKYAIGLENGDLRSLTKEMNRILNGRGGGKPFFVQGQVKANEEEIRSFFTSENRGNCEGACD